MTDFFAGIVDRLRDQFDPTTLGQALAGGVANLVVALLIFAAFYLVWALVSRVLAATMRRTHTDATTASFALTTTKFVLLTLGAVQALSAVGINTAALLTSLGVAGLTLGFAARDALSNLISGVLIFWDRPFVIGDLVEVQDNYGRVDRITLRSTRIVTVDGRMLAVPNSTIINTTVASYTNFPHLRLDIAVGIAVDEDIDRVRSLLLDARARRRALPRRARTPGRGEAAQRLQPGARAAGLARRRDRPRRPALRAQGERVPCARRGRRGHALRDADAALHRATRGVSGTDRISAIGSEQQEERPRDERRRQALPRHAHGLGSHRRQLVRGR